MTARRLPPLLTALIALAAIPLEAQPLALKRETPPTAWGGCFAPPFGREPAAVDRAEAARLAGEATQAALLGDGAGAHRLLERAASLDPTSADLAFRLALSLEQLDRPREAVDHYCRYVTLDPDAADAAEVLERLPQLATASGFTVAQAAAEAFQRGVAAWESGRVADAEAEFGRAWQLDRRWGAPLYNRALTRFAAGRNRPALDDLRQYLELSPGAADFQTVLDAVVAYGGAGREPVAPAFALASGLVVPGLGHFTTGRPGRGALVLGSAAGALAAGFGFRRVDISCASPVEDGVCPPEAVLGRRTERPYLGAGIAAAAAIGMIGAFDAYREASRARAAVPATRAAPATELPPPARRGASLAPPAAHPSPDGVLLELVRIRF